MYTKISRLNIKLVLLEYLDKNQYTFQIPLVFWVMLIYFGYLILTIYIYFLSILDNFKISYIFWIFFLDINIKIINIFKYINMIRIIQILKIFRSRSGSGFLDIKILNPLEFLTSFDSDLVIFYWIGVCSVRIFWFIFLPSPIFFFWIIHGYLELHGSRSKLFTC